jgi:hypothetical protein
VFWKARMAWRSWGAGVTWSRRAGGAGMTWSRGARGARRAGVAGSRARRATGRNGTSGGGDADESKSDDATESSDLGKHVS